MINAIRQRIEERVAAYFVPREILIRSSGRVRYLYLSTRSQLLGAAALGGAVTLALSAAVWAVSAVPAQPAAALQASAAAPQAMPVYTGLAAEVNGFFDQFREASGPALPDEATALASTSVIAVAPGGRITDIAMQIAAPDAAKADAAMPAEDDARRQLRLALQKKLRTFDSDLQQIAARNQSLHDQVAALTETVRTLRRSSDGLQAQNNELTAQLAGRDTEQAALTTKVQDLTRELEAARRDRQVAMAHAHALDQQMASLQGKVDAADEDKSDLAQQIAQTEKALATVVAQRNTLQTTRADMSQSISGLKERLASLQETQADFVSGLAERARSNMVEMEKTVAMTGLNVEKLLRGVDDGRSGQGGPFIPASVSAKDAFNVHDAVGSKLMASVATLDDEVGRWEKLRVILHSLPLTPPIDHYYISSSFGERVDPINGEAAIHEGIDMVGALRSEVLATAPGRVVMAGWQTGYGRVVEVDHGFGVHTFYAHLDSIQVTKGQTVDYRDVLGRLGTTGRSSGPHVHYEVRYNKRTLDPMGFLKAGRYVFKG